MRKLLFVIAAAGLLVVALAPVAIGDSNNNKFKASLNGYYEVPSISTVARASFRAELKGATIHYRLTIRDFSENPLFAHIHFARPDVNGGVAAFLCGGGGKPVCPASGTVTGTIVAADVVGPNDQGIAPGQFGELIRAMRNGATYANIHSPTYRPGEIRGNITRND